jgi:hypothetical protein
MSQFRTTKVLSHFTTIPLFWFIQADEEQRTSTESALDDIIDRCNKDNLETKTKRIVGVPWLRNYTASIADVFATARGFETGEGHVLGFDTQSLEDGTLLVLHCVNGKEPEIGRASREEAVGALLRDHLYKYTLAEALNGCSWTKVPIPVQDPESTVEDCDTAYDLPSHIPSGLRLQEDNIVLFSLIRLTDKEVSVLKRDMGDTTNEITIYNWPYATPASQAETYSIFQSVKPEIPVPQGQTFVMFVDAAHLSGPQRAPVVVVACEAACETVSDGSRSSRLEQMTYKHIYLRAERAHGVRALWPLIWHPPNRGSVSGVVVNYPLFYGKEHSCNNSTASRTIDWGDPVVQYPESFIVEPGLAVCAYGPASPEYIVYIFCPVTPMEIRTLRHKLDGGSPLLIELNIVPRLARAEREGTTSEHPTTGSSTRLDPLLAFFDTPAYRAVSDPPGSFVFLDNEALDDLLSSASDNPSVPLATIYSHFDRSVIACEYPAYLFSNIIIDQGVESTLANLGNMWFWELIGEYGDELHIAFWPEYRGSLTKEMLDIDWEWS